MNKVLIVGHGGRESSFATNLASDSQVYAVAGHANPTIEHCCKISGGQLALGSVEDGRFVAEFARQNDIDYALVNADGPLSQGVVDELMKAGIKTVGPTRAGSRIEWDKIFSIRLLQELFPQYCPRFAVVEQAEQAEAAVAQLCEDGSEVVVKPQGLTGGKGVKVMGEHLADTDSAVTYITELLADNPHAPVLVVEKLNGIEFTLMGLTDGQNLIGAPITYDYPYRLEGDKGPGTGGMGCFTDHRQPVFFLTPDEYAICLNILAGVIDRLGQMKAHFSGILNGGFFLTSKGLYFMEFNARIGDPEGVNILALMKSSLGELLQTIHSCSLRPDDWPLEQRASVVKYLVSPSYPNAGEKISFRHDTEAFTRAGINTCFASAVSTGQDGHFSTVSSSRILALSTLGDTITQAAERINQAVEQYADKQMQYRADIGLQTNLDALADQARQIRQHNSP